MDPKLQQRLENELGDQPMEPEVRREPVYQVFTEEGTFVVPDWVHSQEELKEMGEYEHRGFKWISRLAMPGCLDSTDWLGPFDSEDEATKELLDTFGIQ